MNGGNQIRAVVHGDVGTAFNGRAQMFEKSFPVLALDGEHGNFVVLHEARRHIVLRGQRIRSAKHDIRAAGF